VQPLESTGVTVKLIRNLYDWVLSLAETSYSLAALFVVALIESFIFPIPPDPLLMAMCVGKPERSLRFAGVTTLGSLVGAGIGYGIGHWLWYNGADFSPLANWFFEYVPGFKVETFHKVQEYFDKYTVAITLAAAFTPIPFKVVTITAGAFKANFFAFIITSIIGRAGRFFLVAGFFYKFGEPAKVLIDKYFTILTIVFTILLIAGFAVLKLVLHH
jgi:membrane protein YqaA with SNARE-associated domain